MGRVILHADMDAFFASVEQRDHPEYRGKPVIVGATSARGVVSAASYEARKFGVRSAMPGFEARKRCPEGIFLAGDMRKYAAVSREVHLIFEEFTNQIEPLALDEAFLDITGSLSLFGSARRVAELIKARVRERLELPISVGIAPNKLVAKIACGRGKPDGLLEIQAEEVSEFLAPLPARTLFGIGRKAAERLSGAQIHTIFDLREAEPEVLREILGNQAETLRQMASGVDERPVVTDRDPKSIGEENTFPDDVSETERVLDALTIHAETIASRLRRAGFRARTVTLKVKLGRRRQLDHQDPSVHELYPMKSRQLELPNPSADADDLRRAAIFLWEKLGLTEAIRLVGLSASKLEPLREQRQMDLFSSLPKQAPRPGQMPDLTIASRGEQLGRTLDALADRFGQGIVRRAVTDEGKIMEGDRPKVGEAPPQAKGAPKEPPKKRSEKRRG